MHEFVQSNECERLDADAQPGNRHREAPGRKVSRGTVKDALRLVRGAFQAAIDAGHLDEHPCPAEGPFAVKLPREPGRTREHRTYLRPAEIPVLLADEEVLDEDRDAAEFALYSGLRQGEQWTLHLDDVRLDEGELVVRFGGRKKRKLQPTKNGNPRTIEILPPLRAVIGRQLARLAATHVTPTTDLTRCRTCARSRRKHGAHDPDACDRFVEPYPPRPRKNPRELLPLEASTRRDALPLQKSLPGSTGADIRRGSGRRS